MLRSGRIISLHLLLSFHQIYIGCFRRGTSFLTLRNTNGNKPFSTDDLNSTLLFVNTG